jgi:hypothetical protein
MFIITISSALNHRTENFLGDVSAQILLPLQFTQAAGLAAYHE